MNWEQQSYSVHWFIICSLGCKPCLQNHDSNRFCCQVFLYDSCMNCTLVSICFTTRQKKKLLAFLSSNFEMTTWSLRLCLIFKIKKLPRPNSSVVSVYTGCTLAVYTVHTLQWTQCSPSVAIHWITQLSSISFRGCLRILQEFLFGGSV